MSIHRGVGLDTGGESGQDWGMRDPAEKKVALLELTAASIIVFIVLTVLAMIFLYKPA